MSLTGVTFANQKITPSDDGRLYGSILSDGILTGCAVTFAAATLSIAAGSMLIGTRELRTSGETLSITGATSGYARVIVDIDLTRAATKTSFEQSQLQIQYAASQSAFPALVQQDINAAGTHYQAVFCVVSLGEAGITAIVSKLGISRIASGRLGDGAVQTANIGDGVVTRAKLAQDAKGTLLQNIKTANPFTPENNGALCYDYSATAAWDIDANVLATLPNGWTMTFLNASASGVFTFTFKNMEVMDFIRGIWSNVTSKSFVAQQFGDGLKFIKYASGIMVIGAGTVRSIRKGTGDPAASLGNVGDLYAQYNA